MSAEPPVAVAIARTGTFTDSRGRPHTFTIDDLDKIASRYDARAEEAPLVLGHPEDNHPAFGWVDRVFRQGDRLCAQVSRIAPGVREAVRDGRYRYVSMSLHPDGRLRHIGLLGAVPPAISGLGPVEMGADNRETVTIMIDFSAADAANEQGAMTMDNDDQKRLGALEEQVKRLTQQLETALKRAEEAEQKLKEAEDGRTAAASEAEAAKTEFAAYRGKQEKAARAARLDDLVKAGKVTPGEGKDLLAQAEALALIPTAMEFSSGETMTPEERLWRSLEGRAVSPLCAAAAPPAAAADAAPLDLSRKL